VLLFYELSLVQDSILKRSKVEHRLKIFCKKSEEILEHFLECDERLGETLAKV